MLMVLVAVLRLMHPPRVREQSINNMYTYSRGVNGAGKEKNSRKA